MMVILLSSFDLLHFLLLLSLLGKELSGLLGILCEEIAL